MSSCSFWPHCGACNNLATFDHNSTVTLKRQNSLRNQKEFEHNRRHQHSSSSSSAAAIETEKAEFSNPKHCCHTHDAIENGGNRVVVPLRRRDIANNAVRNERELSSSSPLFSLSRNVNETKKSDDIDCSTVSVNVNVIKFETAVKGQQQQHQQQKNQSVFKTKQWTLLHPSDSNATKLVTSTKCEQVNDGSLTVSRVVPLAAATSFVFLGDCEMPITRDRDSMMRSWANGTKYGTARFEDGETTWETCNQDKK